MGYGQSTRNRERGNNGTLSLARTQISNQPLCFHSQTHASNPKENATNHQTHCHEKKKGNEMNKLKPSNRINNSYEV